MKRWVILVLFSFILTCPAVARAADDPLETGKSTQFDYPLLKFPIGSGGQESNASKDKKDDPPPAIDEKKEKEIRDKKVDDAIKKAWEEQK